MIYIKQPTHMKPYKIADDALVFAGDLADAVELYKHDVAYVRGLLHTEYLSYNEAVEIAVKAKYTSEDVDNMINDNRPTIIGLDEAIL